MDVKPLSLETEFNSNVATLERIDQLLRLVLNSHFEMDLGDYFKHLRNLQTEIIVKMDDTEKAVSNKQFDVLRSKFFCLEKKSLSLTEVLEFEGVLYQFELFLRGVANKCGMLLANKKDSSWDALK